MIELWKIKLRAWLIDLVREAFRLELGKYSVVMPSDFASMVSSKAAQAKTASRPAATVVSEPSFEQQERDSIAAQEKHYAPEA